MRRSASLFAVLLAVGLAGGCVERSFVVETNPPGAFVLVNDEPLSAAPADGSFVYYGNYHFTLIKPGYETLHVNQPIPPPWYAYPPLDFFVEHLWPFKIQDKRRFVYELSPAQVPNADEVLRRSEELRQHGHSLRPPAEAPAAMPPATMPPAER